jgi:hypothetical protein
MGVTQVACSDDAPGFGLQSRATAFIPDGTMAFIEIAECTGTALGFGGTAAVQITASVR